LADFFLPFILAPVVAFLRFAGVTNAAVWLGAVVFFTVAGGPAFFSNEMVQLIGKPRAGAAAQILLERFFLLQHWCAGIALAHLLIEWLYTGRPWQRSTLVLLLALLALGLAGGYGLQPRMKDLHLRMYAPQLTPAQRENAKRVFWPLHGAAQVMNLVVMGGVLVYLWQITSAAGSSRTAGKFRG
jgi:hypothetical protein